MSPRDAAAEVCIENIGPGERRKRRVFGLVAMAVGVALAATLLYLDLARAWRLTVLLPLWAGAVGWFQAQEHT